MKKSLALSSIAVSAMLLLGGCVAAIGNRDAQRSHGTLGQELIDLQKARDAGAITDAEYQTQKGRLLGNK